ncbi:hypothetical protein C8A00DRAFT_40244 [Chaetomidium leptoderma]|uniref:Uncharacterized protein n=1 Tax=Chaetomidium leptoderma TaxID=669021 RepID=A0AAN6VU01_9PEZI|nr:hypothetical protein C8A00DRAFT_40244 [Chaetomidium leptoderma]
MSERAPGKEQLHKIAQEAERDLSTNQSKTGTGKGGDVDETGRSIRGSASEGAGGPEDTTAHVYQHNLDKTEEATVRGWGMDPPHKLERATLRDDRPDTLPADQALGGRGREPAKQGDVSEQGRMAAKANVGLSAASHEEVPTQGSQGSQFKGEYYETPESVPDQRADQNEVPPESVTETSKYI